MHFHRLLGAALAALFFLGTQQAQAANSPLTQKRGTITTQNLVAAGACTTGGCVESEITTAGSVTVQVTGTYTASGGLSAQATTDGSTWVTLCSSACPTTFIRSTTGATSATIASGVQDIFQVPATGFKRLRITALGAVTGTATITIQPTELVPSGTEMSGVRSGSSMVSLTQPNTTAAINVSTATTTQLVALSSGQVIHVASLSVIAGGTGNITFVYGTGASCGTGTTSLTGAYPLIANAGLSVGGGLGAVLVVPAGNALCVTTSAAVQMSGHVTYTQFTP